MTFLKENQAARKKLCSDKSTLRSQRNSKCSKLLWDEMIKVWKQLKGDERKRFFMAMTHLSDKVAALCTQYATARKGSLRRNNQKYRRCTTAVMENKLKQLENMFKREFKVPDLKHLSPYKLFKKTVLFGVRSFIYRNPSVRSIQQRQI